MRWIRTGGLCIAVSLLAAFPSLGEETTWCGAAAPARWESREASVSLPLSGIVGRILRKLGVPFGVPDLVLEWTLEDTLIVETDCSCPPSPLPCCSGPNARAFALLNLFQDVSLPIEYFGRVVPPQGDRISKLIASGSAWRPEKEFGGMNLCGWPGALELSVRNYTGSLGLSVRPDLLLGVDRVSVSIDARPTCQCNPREGCTEDHAPLLSTIPLFAVPVGETRVFLVTVSDKQKDVRRIDVSKGAEIVACMYDERGNIVGASVRVPSTLGAVVIQATDECGQTTRVSVPVVPIHRPKIEVSQKQWGRRAYTVLAFVTDNDLYAACVLRTIHERLELKASCSGGGKFFFSPGNVSEWVLGCFDIFELDGTFGTGVRLVYEPPTAGVPRDLTLELGVTDAWGFSESWRLTLVNGVPVLEEYRSFPPASSPIKVRFGEQVSLTVSFTDPDGDWLTLRQVRGPGAFGGKLEGLGRVEGTFSWRADSWQRYWWIEFECQDYVAPDGLPYQGAARAAFLIQVLQPPRAYNGYATVPRGGRATASLYVYDPDTPPGGLAFSFSPPAGITVHLLKVEEPPYYYGSYHGYTARVAVSVDKGLCPGTYSVPFTVTDPDGLSSAATLHVHVVGNRPPAGQALAGRAAVVLTPGGIEARPVVLGPLGASDPEGDRVILAGVVGGRYGWAEGVNPTARTFLFRPHVPLPEACAAVRDKDTLVDELTATLRDACGAETTVPVTVSIAVEDKVPPRIVSRARDRTVECDGQGNVAALSSWLRLQGGAWADDNCCDVRWMNDYSPDRFVTTCGKAGYVTVTFTAHDCAGNSSSTTATFRIVDTTKPRWNQTMPPDVTVECHQVPPPPLVSATDTCDPNVAVTFEETRVDGPCPYTYTLLRTWRARDACGNSIAHTQRITVRDTTPPVLTAPPDMDLGCNPPDTSPEAAGWATATDNCDPSPEVSYTDRISTVGCRITIERTWAARDACGNASAPKLQRITYTVDTTPPFLTVPGDVVVECHQVPPVGPATATDTCDPAPRVEYLGEERMDGPCPHTYTLTRTWRATDACGNSVTRRQTITVRDTTPPVLTAPPNVDLGCNPPDTSPDATGWATATDNCDPSPQVSYTDRVSTVGCRVTIERTWTARDACGNASAPKLQRIVYTQDTTPPTIRCPGHILIRTCFPLGTWVWVNFGITATDNCGTASLVCDRYGDWFQVGTTTPVTVSCTATDACGNTTSATCAFLVTVEGNRPPVAWSTSTSTTDGIVCIPVPASDPDGDPLDIEVFDPSPCGATWVSGNRVCYGTYGCEGWQIPPGTVARFMFRVTDPCGASATGWVYVTILCEICPTALPPGGEP